MAVYLCECTFCELCVSQGNAVGHAMFLCHCEVLCFICACVMMFLEANPQNPEPALEICCGARSDRHREKETVNMGQKDTRRDDLHGAMEVLVPDVRNMTFPLMEPIRILMERVSPFLILKRFQRPVSLRFGFTLCETS